MDTIAAEAEVSKGTLYSYFQDKDELYRALLARASTGMIDALECAAKEHDGARARLVAIVDAVLTYFDAEPHLFDLIQRVELLSRSEVEFPWQQARDVAFRLVHETCEQGQASGEFTVADPELGGLILFGGVRSVIRFGKRPMPANLAEILVDTFLFGAAR
jgi:AcrR family transcriptional regulator